MAQKETESGPPNQETNTTISPSSETNPPCTAKGKRKRPSKKKSPIHQHIIHQRTIRHHSWSYIHLQQIPNNPPTLNSSSTSTTPLDAITTQLSLQASLAQFLGLHGSAIRFDILKIEAQDVWIRVSAADRRAFVAAVGGSRGGSSAGGWRVKGCSSWDAAAGDGEGRNGGWELFDD